MSLISKIDQSIRDIENVSQWITWLQQEKVGLDKEEAKLDAQAKAAVTEVDSLQPKVEEWGKAVSDYATFSSGTPYRSIFVSEWEKKRQVFETVDMDRDTLVGWLQNDYKRDIKRTDLLPLYDQVLEDIWKQGLENTKLSDLPSKSVNDYKAIYFLLSKGIWSIWKLHDAMFEEDNTAYFQDLVYDLLSHLFEKGEQTLVPALIQGGVEGVLKFYAVMDMMLEQKYKMKEPWKEEAWVKLVWALPLELQQKDSKKDLAHLFKRVWASTKYPYLMQVVNSTVYSRLRPFGIWPTVFATLPDREDAYLFLLSWIEEVLASDVPTLYMQTLVRWIREHVRMTQELSDRLASLGY